MANIWQAGSPLGGGVTVRPAAWVLYVPPEEALPGQLGQLRQELVNTHVAVIVHLFWKGRWGRW